MATGGQLSHPGFFKVLLSGFLEKLLIPREFTKHIGRYSGREATLMSPLRKPWQVKIHKNGEEVYFGDGWKELAEAHDLHVGYFLVFCYQGDMVFSFTVYDLSACEKDYHPVAVLRRTVKQKVTHPEEKQTTNEVPKRVKQEVTNPEEEKQIPSEVPKKRKQKAIKLSSEELNLGLKRSWERFNPRKPNLFGALIHRSNLSWKQLNIPLKFKESNGLSENRGVLLVDPEGRSWPVHFRLGRQDGMAKYRPVFGIGWREFAVNNNLRMGDKCIFQLVSKKTGVIHVQILRQAMQ